MPNRRSTLLKRIRSRCEDDEDGCWIWQGSTSGKVTGTNSAGRGYGRISIDGHTSAVHRVMWVLINGYLPPRVTVDHKCNKRLCCRPSCLEAVTHKENCKRRNQRA